MVNEKESESKIVNKENISNEFKNEDEGIEFHSEPPSPIKKTEENNEYNEDFDNLSGMDISKSHKQSTKKSSKKSSKSLVLKELDLKSEHQKTHTKKQINKHINGNKNPINSLEMECKKF